MIAVICVEVGNYCGQGERYVRTLKAMVKRNLTVGHEFYCITDVPKPGVNCIEALSDLTGWYQKLYQFKEGLFQEERILFFDLDTFIIRNIDDLGNYNGAMAMLRDFWQPNIVASGVMAWANGGLAHLIWDTYESDGMPQTHPNGDGGVIGDMVMPFKPHLLQDLAPGYFVSYKTECLKFLPQEAHVVCFHGMPRPSQAKGWAKNEWNRFKPMVLNG